MDILQLIINAHFIVAIVVILPLVLNLKYYIQSRYIDYLLVFIFLFFWSVWSTFFFTTLNIDLFDYKAGIKLFVYVTFDTFDALPLFIVAVRAKYMDFSKIPKKVIAWGSLPLIFWIINIIDAERSYWYFLNGELVSGKNPFDTEDTLAWVTTTWYWMVWNARIVYHSFIAYAFLTAPHMDNPRASITRWLWVGHSTLWVVLMLFLEVNTGFLGWDQQSNLNLTVVFMALFVMTLLLLLTNHLPFPESVIITPHQLVRARNLYGNVQKSENPIIGLGVNRIKEYIANLPGELLVDA